MSCVCENCGKPIKCGKQYCEECLMERFDRVGKNIYLGGRFFEEQDEGKGDNEL